MSRDRVKQAKSSNDHYYRNRPEILKKKYEREKMLKDFVSSFKNVPCTDCGVKYPSYVMDFDHVRDKKIDNVSVLASRGFSKKRILEEITKCEIVCSNCHRERTHKRYI